MSYFKFEVNWTINGVDMTSQTYTHFIYAHMRDLVPPIHMGPYKMCDTVYRCAQIKFTHLNCSERTELSQTATDAAESLQSGL